MKTYSIDLRQKIIDIYENEWISQLQLAKQFRVASCFIVKLLKQYWEIREIVAKPFNGRVKVKLSIEQLRLLAELIENNNDATLDELWQLLKDKTGIIVNRATMRWLTQRLNLTVKKPLHPSEKDTGRVQKLRVEFWNKIRSIPVETYYLLMNRGLISALIRLYARALRGQRSLLDSSSKKR